MKTVLISEFKARCIRMIREVQSSGRPLTVTVRGRPVATVQPWGAEERRPQLGTLRGSVEVHGDIVHSDWDDEWEQP